MFYKLFYTFLWLMQVQNILAVWRAPYFKTAHTTGITFLAWDGVQKISVQEELPWPFALAEINYNGTGTPTVGSFDIGDNNLLGANIEKILDGWYINIMKRQDYENKDQQIYSFNVYINGDKGATQEYGILLTLENIFDNNPTVTYEPSPCSVPELHAHYVTKCVFTVYDPDGMDKNNIRIEAAGSINENAIFSFLEYDETKTYTKVFSLSIVQELHYEERAIYNLEVRAYDAANNTGTVFAIIEVEDLPNRDPIWVRPLTTATFDEKQEQFFTVKAIDGDTGINKPICYRLEFEEDYSHLMSVNQTSGEVHIRPIDRDALQQQIFTFFTCAYKCDNYTWAIKNTTILIVQDINDHIPEITLLPTTVQFLEAKYLTLPLDTFVIEDIDLGNNATYNVYFAPPLETAYSDAFYLIPNSGYQRANFSLTVANANSLDYEDENWRNFEITIVAQEIETLDHISNQTLKIELINWNDEWPIFANESYEAHIMENATINTFIQQVLATDRDIDDKVIHTIVGNLAGLQIDADNGSITTTEDDVFDYERQTLVIVQIQAKDTLQTNYSQVLHTAFAQLTINIIDVNDETPELRMPRSIVNITENSPALTLLTNKIEARDPDTTANLKFEILWNESYATKSGQEAERKYYVGCFIIEPHAVTRNLVYGHLMINPEFKLEFEVDYEMYDTIFLTIKVTDLNQEINEDSSTAVLTVRVDDVNDNPPEFVVGTLTEPRKVTEMAEKFTVIGTILAFDIDGPGNNIITYNIRPVGELTQEGLVTINSTTGVMRVNGNILCDLPKIEDLEYEIILTDTVHTTLGNISIHIIDVNNQVPETDDFLQQVAIFENATTEHFVGQIIAHDNDRDAPHNVLEYTINSANGDVRNLFQINITNGNITVNLRNGLVLDRDHGTEYHYIAIDIKDNFNYNNPGYGPVNQKSTFLNVTLLDVNDNAPIMPEKILFMPEFSEADLVGAVSKAQIVAKDIDEPNTPNSWVSYRVLQIRPAQDNADNVANYTDLFDIVGDDKLYGQLRARKNLQSYYGWWQVEIEAYDHGEPRMRNSSTYDVQVRPFNFHAPVIVYPVPNKSIRFCYSLQEVNRPLYQADCISRVPRFEAFDPDGGAYGDVSFHLSSDFGDDNHFKIVKEGRNQSSLYLQSTASAGIYYITVRATDGGGSSSNEIRNLRLVFVDMLGNPMFLENNFTTNFTETELGLAEERFIPEAYDPKNEGLDAEDEKYKMYYFIDETYRPDDARLFSLDKQTRLLKLRTELDRGIVDTHLLRVTVSNNENGGIANPNSVNYTLDITITVNDVNNHPPTFVERFYAAGITLKDTIGKEILTYHAVDPDLDDPTTYIIDFSSIETHGENIAENKLKFFSLDNTTGVLSLNAYVTNSMKGYFMFNVIAYDTAEPPHNDTVPTKIYLVSELNRVKFVFLSDVQAIRENEQFIRESFQNIYDYEICNIDAIEDVTNQQQRNWRIDSGGAFISELIVHFISDNEAVEAAEIQRRSSDLAFISKLQNTLQTRNLILNDVPHLGLDEVSQTLDDWLLTTLIIISVLLTALCAILTVAFVLKTRALNRQLKAFEPTLFGSVSSDLNRMGAPSTNIFAIEGSNPVINNRDLKNRADFEPRKSFSSESEGDDDDFDGLQDDPTFDMDMFKNNKNSLQEKDPDNLLNISDYFKFNEEDEDIKQKIRY